MSHTAIITLRKRDYHQGDGNDITKLKEAESENISR